MIILYAVILFILSVYSFALVDPNLTLISHPLWVVFREWAVNLGYYQRGLSFGIYLGLVIVLFILNYFFSTKYKNYNPVKIAILTAVILLFSYPFLSHDFFNYLFDAKIVTFYHQNPYLKRALDFPADQWVRFMHWTHRTYPYGPIFLLITLVPSFLSLGKFFLAYTFFKLTFIIFYLLAVYFLNKMNKKWAIILATHPLIIMEGLVSSHNDLIALSLAVIGIYFFFNKKNLWARILLVLSFGIKYVTLPLIFLAKRNKIINYLALFALVVVVLYMRTKMEIQPWYFLPFFAFLPFFEELIVSFNIFFAGLLFSYYPYIFLGGWDTTYKVILKNNIINAFFFLNIFYLFFIFLRRKLSRSK